MLNKYKKIALGLWLGPIIALIAIFVLFAVFSFVGDSIGINEAVQSLINIILGILGFLSLVALFVGFFLSIVFILKGDDVGDSRFRMKEAIRFGWETAKKNFWFFLGVIIVTLIVQFLPMIYDLIFDRNYGGLSLDLYAIKAGSLIVSIIFWVLSIIVSIGWIKIALKFAQNKEAVFSDLFSGWKLFFNYLFGAVLYFLIVLAGIVLFVIPGIVWQLKFQFFPYLIVEGHGPISALKKSGVITKGAKWDLLFFGFLLGLINLLGFILVFIGILWTIPLISVAMAFVYVKLKAQVKV